MDSTGENDLYSSSTTAGDEFLADYADALVLGHSFTAYPAQYGLKTDESMEIYELLDLFQQVRASLTPIEPSLEFTQRLKTELGTSAALPPALLVRWRKLPAGYRLAARLGGLTLTAIAALLTAKRMIEVIAHNQRPNIADA